MAIKQYLLTVDEQDGFDATDTIENRLDVLNIVGLQRLDNTFIVRWSPEDREYVAMHSAFPSLSWLERNPLLALNNLLTMMIEENAWEPPPNTN